MVFWVEIINIIINIGFQVSVTHLVVCLYHAYGSVKERKL